VTDDELTDGSPGGDADARADDWEAGDGEAGDGTADGAGGGTATRTAEEVEAAASSQAGARYDRLDSVRTGGRYNSFRGWYRRYNPLRIAVNYAVIVVCRISPSLKLKRWLLRRLGVTVGEGAVFALESTPDVFFPHLVRVEAHAIVGYDATILCHEFLQDEVRTGEVVVREGAMIGAGAIVLPGVEIGEEAQVAANSLVATDVPPGTTVAGVPAEPVG
jgi:acetyltransferase-like isoleucine patch superfamily enzyme